MTKAVAFGTVVVAVCAALSVGGGRLVRAVEARQAGAQDRVVNIQYIPGMSNAEKLADPFSATYSTLYLLRGGGGHSLTFESDDGVILISTMAPGWGGPILDVLGLITEDPVTTLINTHPDSDYSGGNAEFPSATRIIAHANAKTAMARMPAFQGDNAQFLPNTVFDDAMSLLEGRNRVDLHYFGAGHTDGDTVVIIPTYGTAYLGDLFPSKALPVIDTANGGSAFALPDTLQRALEAIESAGVDYVVAGKAPTFRGRQVQLMSIRDLQEYIDFNRAFLAAVKSAADAGKSAEDAAATLEMPDKFSAYDMERVQDAVAIVYSELQP
jgi:glyoxylase-like metal-dependent hydrolase (beta-lactamase superfamily II)